MTFQEAFKNYSNFDAISTSIFERLGCVLEAQDGSQIDQKSIKIDFLSFSVSASFFTSIFNRFLLPTSIHCMSKKYIIPGEKQYFFKNSPFEDNIDFGFDFGANLPPCWPPTSKIFRNYGLPRSLQNFIFLRIDFLSILNPSWPPTWGHLGSQDGSKSKRMAPKKGPGALGASWGASWGVLGASWGVLGRLDPSWELPGSASKGSWCVLAATTRPRDPEDEGGPVFGPVLKSSWTAFLSIFGSLLRRFLIDFLSYLRRAKVN